MSSAIESIIFRDPEHFRNLMPFSLVRVPHIVFDPSTHSVKYLAFICATKPIGPYEYLPHAEYWFGTNNVENGRSKPIPMWKQRVETLSNGILTDPKDKQEYWVNNTYDIQDYSDENYRRDPLFFDIRDVLDLLLSHIQYDRVNKFIHENYSFDDPIYEKFVEYTDFPYHAAARSAVGYSKRADIRHVIDYLATHHSSITAKRKLYRDLCRRLGYGRIFVTSIPNHSEALEGSPFSVDFRHEFHNNFAVLQSKQHVMTFDAFVTYVSMLQSKRLPPEKFVKMMRLHPLMQHDYCQTITDCDEISYHVSMEVLETDSYHLLKFRSEIPPTYQYNPLTGIGCCPFLGVDSRFIINPVFDKSEKIVSEGMQILMSRD